MKKTITKIVLGITVIAVMLIMASQANALQTPRRLSKESKFRTYVYNPNEIYQYLGHYLYQSYIEFEENEQINTISMGDSTAWQIVPQENRLFLKPVGDYPQTNMTVITNKRIYHFELDAKDAKGINDDTLIYYVKFVYQSQEDTTIVQFPTRQVTDVPDLSDLSKYNFNYEFTGNDNVAPIKVFDDGQFTYMEFQDKNAEIPAIFYVDSNGYEGLVNFRTVSNYVIIERVASQFTLRNGGEIVCIYNNSYLTHLRKRK